MVNAAGATADHGREADTTKKEIAELLERQAAAWTRGELEEFVSVYTEDTSFVAATGITKGRDEVLARYRKRYGNDATTMGALSLEIVELRLANSREGAGGNGEGDGRVHGVSVVAKWKLVWPDKPEKSGFTLLYFEPRGASWRIVHDASM